MIIDDSVTKVEFNKLHAGDCVIITTGSGSTYRLTVKGQLYTKEGLVVSTIVKIDKKLRSKPLEWWHMGFGIITSVRKGYSAVFTEAAGYKCPFTRTSWVRSLILLQPEA